MKAARIQQTPCGTEATSPEWRALGDLARELRVGVSSLVRHAGDVLTGLPRVAVGAHTFYDGQQALAALAPIVEAMRCERAEWVGFSTLGDAAGLSPTTLHKYAERFDGLPRRRVAGKMLYPHAAALAIAHALAETLHVVRAKASAESVTPAYRGHLTWARGTNARQAQGRGFWRLRLDANGRRLTIRFAGAEDKRASAELTAAHVTALALAGPLPSGGALVFVDGVLKPLILPPPKPAPRTRRIVEVSRPSGPILACAVRVWRELVGVRERAVRVEAIEGQGTAPLDEALLARDFAAATPIERVRCCADTWPPDVLATLQRFTETAI